VIRRAPRSDRGFTILNTSTFNLPIPPDELGVYLHLLSKPDDWQVSGSYLCNHFSMSKDRGYRILNSLCDRVIAGARLVDKRKYRDQAGRWQTDYIVNETSPENQERTVPENRDGENQEVLSIELTNSPTGISYLPPESVEIRLKAVGLEYDQLTLEHFRTHLEGKISGGKVVNPDGEFFSWVVREKRFREIDASQDKKKAKKKNLFDMTDSELMKLCKVHKIATHGKTTKQIVEKLRVAM
tara:strand:- start:767 stop:1489 length:723 start_codon:yes stop_codon:yes gene_type:complete